MKLIIYHHYYKVNSSFYYHYYGTRYAVCYVPPGSPMFCLVLICFEYAAAAYVILAQGAPRASASTSLVRPEYVPVRAGVCLQVSV